MRVRIEAPGTEGCRSVCAETLLAWPRRRGDEQHSVGGSMAHAVIMITRVVLAPCLCGCHQAPNGLYAIAWILALRRGWASANPCLPQTATFVEPVRSGKWRWCSLQAQINYCITCVCARATAGELSAGHVMSKHSRSGKGSHSSGARFLILAPRRANCHAKPVSLLAGAGP